MDLLASIIQSTLIYSAPIIIAAIGGLYSERSGIVNVGIEGIMMVGGFAGATALAFLENTFSIAPWISLVVALIAGILVSLIHAYLCINLRADQTISGTAINIFAGGITIYLCGIIFGQQRTLAFRQGFTKTNIPFLSEIPIIGDFFFKRMYVPVYLTYIIVIITLFIMYRTTLGLRLRGTGENPHAIDSLGVNVYKLRYIGVLTSGALAGLAGGLMVLTQDTQYTITSIHGIGFIALASLIFGKWRPFPTLFAGLFFGFAQIFALYSDSIAKKFNISAISLMPNEFYLLLPYVITIVALIIFSGKDVGPKAAGEIYDKSKR